MGAAEALFISRTNLPTYKAIPQWEAELRMPVLSANQVTLWAALPAVGARAVGPCQTLLMEPEAPAGTLPDAQPQTWPEEQEGWT